jgi:hypothetical protein
MLLADGRERFKEDMQTMRLMAPDCGASLGLNVDIGKIVQRGHENSGPGRRLPVQLDLLPLRPSHSASGTPEPSSLITKNMFSWQQQQPLRNGSWTNSGSGADLSFVPRSSCCQHSEVLEILNFFVFVCLL